MQIRTRLTLLFTALVAALLVAFACIIYFTAAKTREEEYYKRLKQQAVTKASLLFDTHIQPSVLQLIYKKSANNLNEEEVAIYDSTFHLLYHDAVEIDKVKETKGMIDSILKLGEIQFYQQRMQVIGFVYGQQHNRYVITAAALDDYGYTKLADLRNTLIIALVISVIAIFFVGRFLSNQSLTPVAALIARVKKITATNLDLRVDEGNGKDELSALAVTFNEMLNRLEASFDAQKTFVSNISHELRTPLTAMLTELQLTTAKKRTAEDYELSLHHLIEDTQKLVRLSNSLLDLAKANYDQHEISFKRLRIDEVLIDAQNDLLHHHPHCKVTIAFANEADNEDQVVVDGNAYLLKVAFLNLMENGCKFSENKKSAVTISFYANALKLQFSDEGIGIGETELSHIFEPFFRGSNKSFTHGSGIGLALTKKIIELHHGKIEVQSKLKEGTTFTVTLQQSKTRL